MSDYMPAPCKHCPFRTDVRPFLHPSRAEEIAYSASNRYSEFPCHKTLGHDDDEGDTCVTADSKTCAGFLAMQINEAGIDEPEGWKWPDNVYADAYEMIDAYEQEWNSSRRATP